MTFKRKLYGDPVVNSHIAEITGQQWHYRPAAWIRGEEKYSHIAGAIIMPLFHVPGYLLTVGVEHDTPGHMVCLDEFQSEDENVLLGVAQKLQDEYGPDVISIWYGDQARLMSMTTTGATYISPAIDSEQTDCFQLYLVRLKTALAAGHKTLTIGDCNILRNAIQSFVREKAAKEQDHPEIYAAGALVHSALMTRPWEYAGDRIKLTPTIPDDPDPMAEMDLSEVYGC
jgi:hypothetical protein